MVGCSMSSCSILIPCALFLSFKAQLGEIDGVFYEAQVLELTAGAINIVLLALNLRDGRRTRSAPMIA
jgi:hypothetical protein